MTNTQINLIKRSWKIFRDADPSIVGDALYSKLEKPEEIQEELIAMAQRHAGYGVRPAHYRLIGKALLWTLQTGLGVFDKTERPPRKDGPFLYQSIKTIRTGLKLVWD